MNLLGQPVRKIADADKRTLFLTFDDGPEPESTPRVLETLKSAGVRATFFVVAQKARDNSALIRRALNEGHAIGNHSLDHGYSKFFRGRSALKGWVDESEHILSNLIGHPTVGFRPPAGIRTPELSWALAESGLPLVLWSQRFYDTVFTWSHSQAEKSLIHSRPGSIVLLHDRQRPGRLPLFLRTLQEYIFSARERGFEFEVLSRELIVNHGRRK